MKSDLFYCDPDVVFLVSGLHSNGSSTFFLRFDHTGFADSYDLLVGSGVSNFLFGGKWSYHWFQGDFFALNHVTFCKLVTGVSAALSFRLWPRFSVAFLPCFLPVAAFVTLMDFVATAGF